MKVCKFSDSDYQNVVDALVNRSNMDLFVQDETVRKILNDVKEKGDEAVLQLTHRFDRHTLPLEKIKVSAEEITAAYNEVKPEELDALKEAEKRIRLFHERQKQDSWSYEEAGVMLGQMVRPLAVAGIYVPGGKASYPSSVLMNAIPAIIAGVKRRVMVTPISDLKKSSIVLAAAHVAGVTDFFCMGGAHSIAALAYGTETIEAVNKIVGPGNAYVAEAKRQVFGKVGIDSIAGPSEVLIVCDDTACSDHIAIDLLSQAEHDEQAQAILITDSIEFAKKVEVSVKKFLEDIPRSKIASTSWYNKGALIVVENMDEAIELINFIAPEHLELAFNNAEKYIDKIKNAGAIFIGLNTPEAVGDYVAGPNHVLPTNGTAKFSSGLSVLDFYKRTTVVKCNKKNLAIIGKHAVTLAKAEGLDAHAMSISLRIDK